jgi:hypothetical protein
VNAPNDTRTQPLTTRQALEMADSKWWVGMSDRDVAMFQLHQPLLCMPFAAFQATVERALMRPVFTHEFSGGNMEILRSELRGEISAPTLDQIMDLIPVEKRIIAVVGDFARASQEGVL